jgi:Protein of unknown function (DUF3606)
MRRSRFSGQAMVARGHAALCASSAARSFSGNDDDMSGLTRKATPDRSKINMHQPEEVKFWIRHLNVSKEDLQKAIDKVGNAAAAVRKELAR